jgi:hypothetical protein
MLVVMHKHLETQNMGRVLVMLYLSTLPYVSY